MRDDWKFMMDRLAHLRGVRDSILHEGGDVPDVLVDEIEHLEVILNE